MNIYRYLEALLVTSVLIVTQPSFAQSSKLNPNQTKVDWLASKIEWSEVDGSDRASLKTTKVVS